VIEGRTFVPARYVAEAFGATVSWNAAIKTVYIDRIRRVRWKMKVIPGKWPDL